jgi:hypothetical protein
MTTASARHAHVRRLPRSALFTAALALLLSVLADPAIARAYDGDYYTWCMDHLHQGSAYCCQQAGGVLLGSCTDPAVIYTPAPPTINQNPGGPIIIVPPGAGLGQ